MSRRIHTRVVLLDWDGTLLNSYAADARAFASMFQALRIEWDVRELTNHYSPDWHRVYRAARIPRAKWTAADRLWKAAYLAEPPALLPGARGVLHLLRKNFVLGLVTGGSRWRVRKQVRDFGFASHFSVCVYCEDSSRRKPHPAPLKLALKRLGADPEDCVYVGDAPEDMEMARRAGVRTVGVLGPFPNAERLRAAKPQILLNSIQELPRYLRAVDRK